MAYFGSTDTLGANGVWTSSVRMADRADNISGAVFSSHAGTLHIQQSADNTNWDIDDTVAVTANTPVKFNQSLYFPFIRLTYNNGATPQTAFRCFARFTSAGDS